MLSTASLLRAVALLVPFVYAQVPDIDVPSANTLAVCSSLKTRYPTAIEYPIDASVRYTTERYAYWSQANSDKIPACMFFPTSTDMVSAAVKLLNNYTDVPFAMKSGGHNPNVGFSSVSGGLLIAFKEMNQVTLSADGKTADIGPGNRWSDVAMALQPTGKIVVGGRLGGVGVGGYLLGGGLSFLSSQHGLACDTIVDYTVVIANGTIVHANYQTNQDLFFALRGGGNSFGLVTNFKMKAFPIAPQVWGGTRIYSADKIPAVFNASVDFTQKFHDPKAAIITTAAATIAAVNALIVFYFYEGPSPPADVFGDFLSVPYLIDQTSTQTYAALLQANDQFNIKGQRFLIRMQTLPSLPLPHGKDLANYHYQTWNQYALPRTALHPGMSFEMAIQPMPVAIQRASVSQAGVIPNVYAFNPSEGDRFWMEYNLSWPTELDDDAAAGYFPWVTEHIKNYTMTKYPGMRATNSQGSDGTKRQYRPLFANDGMFDQQVLQSWDTYPVLKAIQRRWDTKGFFARTGGFKFA